MNAQSPPPKWTRSWWTNAGLILIGLGIIATVLGVVLVARGFMDVPHRLDARTNVPVPGSETVRITRGERGVWLQVKAPSRPDLQNIAVTVTPASGGEPLPVRFPRTVENYDVGGRRGILVGTIEVPETGDYLVVVRGRGGDTVSIGEPTVANDLFDIAPTFVSFSIGVVSMSTGVGLIIMGSIRRRRGRRVTSADTVADEEPA